MRTAFAIRPANAQDCPFLAQLDAQCNPSAWTENQFHSALQSPHSRVLLAEQVNEIVGFIVWQQVFDEIELHLIATAPQARRSGIATALMAKMSEQAAATQASRVFLEVRAGNHAAQALYRRHGFSVIATRTRYYGDEDALIMEQSC